MATLNSARRSRRRQAAKPSLPPAKLADRKRLVDDAIAEIQALHALGCQVANNTNVSRDDTAYGRQLIDRERKRLGHDNETKIRKAKQFAQLYTADDLKHLIRTIRRYEPRTNVKLPVFGVTAVMALVTAGPDDVRKKDNRELRRIQELAIRSAWSTSQLEAYVRARKPRLRQGGRPPVLPDDLPGLRVRIISACHSWQRLVKAIHRHKRKPGLGSELLEVLDKSEKAVGMVMAKLSPSTR